MSELLSETYWRILVGSLTNKIPTKQAYRGMSLPRQLMDPISPALLYLRSKMHFRMVALLSDRGGDDVIIELSSYLPPNLVPSSAIVKSNYKYYLHRNSYWPTESAPSSSSNPSKLNRIITTKHSFTSKLLPH